MTNPETHKEFHKIIMDLRDQKNHNIYDKVNPEVIFLPPNLNTMLSHLYKKTVQVQIKQELQNSLKCSSTDNNHTENAKRDIGHFLNLFSVTVQGGDKATEDLLKRKFRINPKEIDFRN